ncbi:DUF3422 domain-containing protein [Ruegeria pomeroyi]|uniref:DUF3422 domain-containing protein n=2 Tax=Ruegeria TaxID=97050 RepID=A0A9Q3ZN05_9RHOB|nr:MULTISPECIES: DUF3422 domain-containing protein [Ruegeria]MCE8512748.1 DUF3422 domain-containing protein [Ruegeria pomeroyi]MCE8521445.1 DUF3422 domain-containing protein [Ruegeria pomeroyi]MCE8526081.1 DUF3422 domain-containing protein [Ruegeria pomeroyi]MCE8530294.1 DUF3422 domain-containing protein [Ruegeria pomeroyi]MCE8534071.1 DUF3422 domain-containing protein [Ruegeria pomeroyi]
MTPIQDHPLRFALANELHARPFPISRAPCTVAYLAVKQPDAAVGRDREADRAHLIDLLDRHGAAHPQPGATHYAGQIGRHWLKWESHTEFVTYTAFATGVSARPFDPVDFEVFPPDWLAAAPGQRVTSALLRVEEQPPEADIIAALADWFVPESLAAAHVLDRAAVAAGDFRIDPAGHMRFAVFVAPDTGERRIGRIIQRLCEIETYKAMSMLGFARVKALGPKLGELDAALTALMVKMTDGDHPAEELLPQLLSTSAELETMAARAEFRLGATGAYEAIVGQRISSLREERFGGRQTFADFMLRRYEPAMRTVKSTEQRLKRLSDRAIRAGDLLRTRVDVERSAQNQALLESMDRRADLALRLQHTVEGLSVVAVSYYAVSLVSAFLLPLSEWYGIDKKTLIALVTLPVVGLVWLGIQRIRKKLH